MRFSGQDKEQLSAEFISRDEYVPRILYRQAADKTVGNTITETTLLSSTNALGAASMPASYLIVGRTVRVTAWGYYSTAASAVNLSLRFKIAGTTFRAVVTAAATTSVSNRPWKIEVMLTCRTTGATGTVHGQGFAVLATGATTAVTWEMGGNATATVDTTAAAAIDLTAQWSANLAGHTMTCTNVVIETL